MKPVNYIITLLFFTVFNAFSQQGDFFITHHTPGGNADPSANFDLIQRPDGIITIANRSGILFYEGRDWKIYSSSGTPLSFIAADDGVYAGGGFGIGFQPYNDPSQFTKIHADSLIRNILQVEMAGAELIGIEDKKVHVFSSIEKTYKYSIPFNHGYLKKILIINNKPLITTSAGNFWLDRHSLSYADNIPSLNLAFSAHFDDYDIIGTTSGKLYKVDTSGWEEVKLNTQAFEESVEDIEFIDAVRVNENLAINTRNTGVVIINMSESRIERVINHHNGLPDSETYFIAADMEGGIWVGHEFGLSRIAINLPLETLSNFPGLEGNLLNALYHNDFLYVGTSTGLYKLEEVKDFNEVVKYVKKKDPIPAEIDNENKQTKGLFNFLRRRKEADEQDTSSEATGVSYEKQVTKELKSIRYMFKKVPGIDAKVVQQISLNDQLLIGTLRGIYCANDGVLKQLSSDPVTLLWVNKEEDFIIANTYNGSLLSFRKNSDNVWINSHYFDGYQDNIMDIYEDSKDRIWLTSEDEIYFITYDQNNIYAGLDFYYNNSYLDPTYISENASDEVVFNNRFGQWIYDENKKELIAKPVEGEISSFIKGGNSLWKYSADQWHSMSFPINNTWLNVFKNSIFLSVDKKGDFIYVVTDENELYKVPSKNSSTAKARKQNMLLRYISKGDEELVYDNRLRINQTQNDVAIEFIQPEYTGLMNIKYRYRIQGLSDNWTEWSTANNRINLNYVPEGRYRLELMAKTALGEEFSSAPVFVEVVPPYWKRPWFYAFEFTLLGLLLLLTIYLNHNSKRYILLNKLLAFLTLIIIIEFIQVSAESYFETDISPIIGFVIQVVVALIVLPVEGFLRKLIMKDKKLKLPLYLRLRR